MVENNGIYFFMSIFNYRQKCKQMELFSGFFTDNYFLTYTKAAAKWQRPKVFYGVAVGDCVIKEL